MIYIKRYCFNRVLYHCLPNIAISNGSTGQLPICETSKMADENFVNFCRRRFLVKNDSRIELQKSGKYCLEKVWVKPQSKFPKIFIVALSVLSISLSVFYFIFFSFLLLKKLTVSVKVVTANKMSE